jgi:polyhydroxyalkanoate synthesis repressor PhaR
MAEAPKKKRRGRPPAREAAGADPNVTLIKKYGNRRLYDTSRSKYVTLDDLVEIVARGEEMKVVDAQTGEDLTKRVMTQIILHEEEQKRLNLLPLSFLKKLIQYRDESLREFFQKYMSLSLDMFMKAQKDVSGFDPSQTMSGFFPWMKPQASPEATELEELRRKLADLEKKIKK